MANLESSIGEASGQRASTQTGHTLFPGWPYLWIVPIRSIPAAPCFCLAGCIAALQQRCNLPLSSRFDIHGISQTGLISPFVRTQRCMRRSSMSLGRPNQLPTQANEDQAKKQGHCGTQDQSGKLRPRTVRLTVNLPADLADHLRDAVYWTPGLTLAWFIASAIRTSLTELETTNRAPFPKRSRQLRAGRPRLIGQSLKLRPHLTGSGTVHLAESFSHVPTVSPSKHE